MKNGKSPLIALAALYSRLMDQPIDAKQTFHLLNVQFALVTAVFPAELPIVFRLAALAWGGIAMLGVKE